MNAANNKSSLQDTVLSMPRSLGMTRDLAGGFHLAFLVLILSAAALGLFEVARVSFQIFLVIYGLNLVLCCGRWLLVRGSNRRRPAV